VTDSQGTDIQVLQYALKFSAPRPCNAIDGPVERMDTYFVYLTQLFFFDQKEFETLSQKCSALLKKPSNELGWALKGYFAYLKEDYKEAASAFLQSIVLSPENLDNWLDYAFALRHLGSHEASLRIMFHTKDVMKAVVTAPAKVRENRLRQDLKI